MKLSEVKTVADWKQTSHYAAFRTLAAAYAEAMDQADDIPAISSLGTSLALLLCGPNGPLSLIRLTDTFKSEEFVSFLVDECGAVAGTTAVAGGLEIYLPGQMLHVITGRETHKVLSQASKK